MTATITIEGMSCEHCEQTIEEAFCGVDEVSDARANHEADTAIVEGNPDTGDLIRVAEDAGYTAHA